MKNVVFIFLCLGILSCKKESMSAQDIVDKSMEASGSNHYESIDLEYDFRDKHYRLKRDNGNFQFEREFSDSLGIIKDVLNNTSFKRFVNSEQVYVPDSMATRYSSSVNSVHYFVQLPYGLNEKAVNKELLGEVTINKQPYYKIRVTFNEDGGGEDFEDVFIYWMHTESFFVDYLAYSYNEDDGLGLRFREAFNERIVNGIRFVDYNNYKPKNEQDGLESLDIAFENKDLQLLSKIETKNIVVK